MRPVSAGAGWPSAIHWARHGPHQVPHQPTPRWRGRSHLAQWARALAPAAPPPAPPARASPLGAPAAPTRASAAEAVCGVWSATVGRLVVDAGGPVETNIGGRAVTDPDAVAESALDVAVRALMDEMGAGAAAKPVGGPSGGRSRVRV